MNLELSGKTAVVTGGSKGIGLAVVRTLLDEGMRVVSASRNLTPDLAATGAIHVRVDLSAPDGPSAMIERAMIELEGIDVLVNNVGIGDTDDIVKGALLNVIDLPDGVGEYTKGEKTMTEHTIGTREEWLAARLELLQAEKELTRRSDELARRRQELPWVRIDKKYRFETDEGSASLADLFSGRSQLLVYHFMFGPDYTAGCPACSAIADGFDGFVVHLANHDITLAAVSRAPLAKLQAYKRRMGWSFPWASSLGSDFNYDFQAAYTEEQQQSGVVEYNFRAMDVRPSLEAGKEGPLADIAASVGTDWATYTREAPGMSAFALEGGVVYHTYSAYARGLDGLWGMYQWLDRAPRGRNETGIWFRRHDEYDRE